MEEKIKVMAECLAADSAFAEQITQMDAADAVKAFAAKGIAVTVEELNEMAKAIPADNEELDENALSDVAGGYIGGRNPDPALMIRKLIRQWFGW